MPCENSSERTACRVKPDWKVQASGGWAWLAALLWLGMLAGCTERPATSSSSSHSDQEKHSGAHDHEHDHDHEQDHEHDHGHGHEHEHADHHDPEHKPADFPDAVRRLGEFRSGSGEGQEPDDEEQQIVADILGWLPELAAQSELSESEWNEVDRAAGKMASWLSRRKFAPADWEEYMRQLADLEQAVTAYHRGESEFKRRLGGVEESQAAATPEGGE